MSYHKTYEKEEWPDLYLDWYNNFLTVQHFAEWYGMSVKHANEIIAEGQRTDNFTKEM